MALSIPQEAAANFVQQRSAGEAGWTALNRDITLFIEKPRQVAQACLPVLLLSQVTQRLQVLTACSLPEMFNLAKLVPVQTLALDVSLTPNRGLLFRVANQKQLPELERLHVLANSTIKDIKLQLRKRAGAAWSAFNRHVLVSALFHVLWFSAFGFLMYGQVSLHPLSDSFCCA